MRHRRTLSELAATAAGLVSRATGAGAGSTLPGRVLNLLSRSYVGDHVARLPQGTILVSGSNGKTTTTAMVCAVLEKAGLSTISNESGANMHAGIATALLEGSRDADVGVFEVDEAALPSMVEAMRPRSLVLTNIVRDQLDRFSEPQVVADLLRRSAEALPPGASLVANADDALLWHSMTDLQPVGFGLRMNGSAGSSDSEPETCPVCGSNLVFSSRTTAHFGRSACPRSCFRTPEAPVTGTLVANHGLSGIDLRINGLRADLPIGGLHSAYNALATIALAETLGIADTVSVDALGSFHPRFGREETLRWGGRDVHLGLMKNPVGAGVLLDQLTSDRSVGAVMLSLSDRAADGRDVSWIWDARMEDLADLNIPIVASGTRATDMALRLKYGGVEVSAVLPDPRDALAHTVAGCPTDQAPVALATYTAMLDLRGAARGSRRDRVTS